MNGKKTHTHTHTHKYTVCKLCFKKNLNASRPYCGHTYSKSMVQPGKVANPARGQLKSENGKMNISLSAFAPENLVSRYGFGIPIPRQPAHLHTQAKSRAYVRDSSRVPRRRPFIYLKPPHAVGSVPSLSGHAIAYRWRSLPRVRRHRPTQGSS